MSVAAPEDGAARVTSRAQSMEPDTLGAPLDGGSRQRWFKPRDGAAAVGALALVVVGIAYLAYGVRFGLPAATAGRAVLVVVLTQVVPGALVWRVVRPRQGWWLEDIAMGFAIGCPLAIAAQVVAGLSRLSWFGAVLGPLVGAVLLLVPATRTRIVTARTTPMSWWWGPLVAASSLVAFVPLQASFRAQPLTWTSGSRVVYVDADYHLAVAGLLANRGPTRFPWVESEPLAYHWFSHAWVAQVSKVSGAELDEVLFAFMPVLLPLVVAVTVAVSAVRLSGRSWAGPVAAFVTMAGGDLNVFGELTPGNAVVPLSPSMGFAAPMLIATVTVLALRWRGELLRGSLAVLLLVCVGAAGSKGTTIPLVIAGLFVGVVAMLLLDRSRVRQLVFDLIVVVGCFLFVYAAVLRGAGEGIRIDPSAAATQSALAGWVGGVSSGAAKTFAISVGLGAMLARAVGVVGLLTTPRGRRDPLTWLLVGAGVAGAAAVGILYHTHAGQYYFARSAIPLMSLGSALGLVVLVERLGAGARTAIPLGILGGVALALAPVALLGPLEVGGLRHAMAMIGVAGVVLAIVAGLAVVADAGRRSLVGATLLLAVMAGAAAVFVKYQVQHEWRGDSRPAVAASAPGAVSRDQIEAARWLRDHSDVDDLVITNRHCWSPRPPIDCDSRRFVVAAYSERQVLVEGWSYTPIVAEIARETGQRYATVNYWEPDLLALNDGFIAEPSAAAAQQLRGMGVRWIFVDGTLPHAATLEPLAQLRFTNAGVDVYELAP